MFQTYRDAVTDRTVAKLTPDGILCHHPYFYNRMFTADGSSLLYAREDRGRRNLWLLSLGEGSSRQLTDREGIDDFGAMLAHDDRGVLYCADNTVFHQSLVTGEATALYATPAGWKSYSNPAVSGDGRWLATVEMLEEDVIAGNGTWDTFSAQWEKRPLCRIVLANLITGEGKILHRENCWLGHPLLRPGRVDEVFFCHEGPARKIDARLWSVRADGSAPRCLRAQGDDELITHESWMADGSQMAFVYRKQLEAGAEVRGVSQSIRFLEPDTGKETVVMDCSVYCHAITDPAGRFLAGDGQDPDEPFIFLVDLARKREALLCAHDTSWRSYGNTQDAHPHPAFTPDSSGIVFTSDRDGMPGIYLVQAAGG